jgi:hypothetical protein
VTRYSENIRISANPVWVTYSRCSALRPPAGILAALISILALISGVSAADAGANTTHGFEAAFPARTQHEERGVALDEQAGRVFATDVFQGSTSTVELYGLNGEAPVGVQRPIEGAFGFNGGRRIQLAVDNSLGSPSRGTLYATDRENNSVKYFRFDSATEKYEAKGELKVAPPINEPDGVAVDEQGNVYVSEIGFENANGVVGQIAEFSPTGAEIRRFPVDPGLHRPGNLALDSTGDLFVEVGDSEATAEAIYEISATALAGSEPGAGLELWVKAPSRGLAIDRSTGSLYVAEGPRVSEFSVATGIREGTFGAGHLEESAGIAVNEESGSVYVANRGGVDPANLRINKFGPTVQLPDASTEAATNLATNSATLNGSVNPKELTLQSCSFAFGKTESYGHEAPCAESPVEIGAGSTPVPVHADISGLAPGEAYHFRLKVTIELPSGEVATSEGEDEELIAAGPRISGTSIIEVGDTSAVIGGNINPRGIETTYQVEYATSASFTESGWQGAVLAPVPPGALPAGNVDVPVAIELHGLDPHTTYRARLVAHNTEGVAAGELDESGEEPARQFTTFEAPLPTLPDSRVYEQASPVEKNGANALGEVNTVQAAADGEGITFFSTLGIPGGEGAQKFPVYLATRNSDASGWTTQGLLPPASTGPFAEILGWGADLNRVYESSQQIGSPSILYQRNSSDGSLRSIIEASGSAETPFRTGGESAGGTALLFEAETPTALAAGAAAGAPNAFLWDATRGRVVTAGVMNNRQAPAGGTFVGSNTWFTPGRTEEAGASLFYYNREHHAISEGGSVVFFTGVHDGQLFARRNPTQKQSPLDGQGKCTDLSLACTIEVSAPEVGVIDPNGAQPASFIGATADGSTVFFLSAAKLTADATTGPNDEGRDLYRYDLATGGLADLTPDTEDAAGADVQGLLGMSADGSHLYIAANGRLGTSAQAGNCVPGVNLGACNVFSIAGGTPTLVARVNPGAQAQGTVARAGDIANWAPTAYYSEGEYAEEQSARVSADGQTLLFRSVVPQTNIPTEGFSELYVYRAATGETLCISCSPTDLPAQVSASLQGLPARFTGPRLEQAILTRNLSDSGNRVFFDTAEKLVPTDVNGVNDVYEWEAPDPTDPTNTCHSANQNGGCLYLISGGTDPQPSYFADSDETGRNAFFFTTQKLVGQDRDGLQDVYDARVGGGISAQDPPAPSVCTGEETCRGPAPSPPESENPGSSTVNGPGNPPHKKPKHHQKKHKKPKHKHHKKKHKSNSAKKHGKKKGAGR